MNITPTSADQTTGAILQVLQSVKTDTTSIGALYDSPTDTGISCSITPSATSSKILVDCNLVTASTDSFGMYLWLVRGSTQILLSDAACNSTRSTKFINTYSNSQDGYKVGDVNIKYLDSPSYSLEDTITYKVQGAIYSVSSSKQFYINRCHNDNNDPAYDGRSTSTITLMEIAG